MCWIERGLALLAWLSAPAYIAVTSLLPNRMTTCVNGRCTTGTSILWQQDPVSYAAVVAGALILGVAVAGLIYAHSRTLSTGLLVTMWVLAPVLLTCVIGFAFTWMGTVAFFWGACLLLAAIVGTIRQSIDHVNRHRRARLAA